MLDEEIHACARGDRRLVEAGVRFATVSLGGWDTHSQNFNALKTKQLPTLDQTLATLINDLDQRGLLDSTIVIFATEFGRTPASQGTDGRDHHPNAFTMWLAGGGIKPGVVMGETDELGFNVVKDKVHVHDLHATILQLLGLDHTRLTYKFQGRDFRLTDVAGNVVKQLVA